MIDDRRFVQLEHVICETNDELIRDSFTSAWDEYFYELFDEELEEDEMSAALIEHMHSRGWTNLGTVKTVGLNNLRPNDALTSQEDNEFYQFVLQNNRVQGLGGRGMLKLDDDFVDGEFEVWRRRA